MKYEITVAEDKVTMFEAFCVAKGFAGPQAFFQAQMDGQVSYAEKIAAENDRGTLVAQAAKAEVWTPVMEKYEALDTKKKADVDAILATAVSGVPNEEPLEP